MGMRALPSTFLVCHLNLRWQVQKTVYETAIAVTCGESLRAVRLSCWGLFQEGSSMTAKDYRRIALSLPGASEGSHQGHADFRVGGKIFCTLAYEKEGYDVLKLSPEEQAGLVEDAPEVFSPVPGGWGRMGMTRVKLDAVSSDVLEGARLDRGCRLRDA
jgi:YjbR